MGRGGRIRAGYRGNNNFEGRGGRGSYDDRWDPKDRYSDPDHDLRDLYDESRDPASDECVWPEFENDDDD